MDAKTIMYLSVGYYLKNKDFVKMSMVTEMWKKLGVL